MLELIDRINDTAHLAFDGQAEILARFNKDLLLRATRTSRKKADKTVEPPAPQPAAGERALHRAGAPLSPGRRCPDRSHTPSSKRPPIGRKPRGVSREAKAARVSAASVRG